MKNVRVLDCTLRDGGRIIDCAFDNQEILEISNRLAEAKIDIIEIGFLRDGRKVQYKGNSTFFTDVEQIRPFINKENKNTIYAAFIDFGMCDIDNLKPFDGTSIDAIRFGFTKNNYDESKEEVVRWINIIRDRGYKLFIQGVNSLNYTDRELLEIVDMVNNVHPYSFGIVDTYGAMYMDDVDRLYSLIDHNMLPDICINFHSHNNYQLSFAFAQEVIKLSGTSNRKIIIDGTLGGMGKVAGNLNLELIVDYLVRKKHYDYFLNNNKVKDSKILKYYEDNKNLHKKYKYDCLIFDDKKEAIKIRSNIKNSDDFKNNLKNKVRNYDIYRSEFVYNDDNLLKESSLTKANEISNVFKYKDSYIILMVNSINNNKKSLLLDAKELYLRNEYNNYLKNLIKNSNIKLFI